MTGIDMNRVEEGDIPLSPPTWAAGAPSASCSAPTPRRRTSVWFEGADCW